MLLESILKLIAVPFATSNCGLKILPRRWPGYAGMNEDLQQREEQGVSYYGNARIWGHRLAGVGRRVGLQQLWYLSERCAGCSRRSQGAQCRDQFPRHGGAGGGGGGGKA